MKNGKLHRIISNNILRLVFIVMSLLVVVPIGWVIITSFKSSAEYLTDPWALPEQLHFENYVNAFVKAEISNFVWLSI